MYQVFLRQTM